MNRITVRDTDRAIATVNRLLGFSEEDIKNYRTIGVVRIGSAYGGYRVEKVCNEFGGITVLSHDGYDTRRKALSFLDGMIAGLSD